MLVFSLVTPVHLPDRALADGELRGAPGKQACGEWRLLIFKTASGTMYTFSVLPNGIEIHGSESLEWGKIGVGRCVCEWAEKDQDAI
jgi:hypothetical protein